MDLEATALFSERYPRYALQLMSWEQKTPPLSAPSLPAAWLSTLPLQHAEALYLYGLGDGQAALQLFDWLSENRNRRLIFLEPDTRWIVHSLRQPFSKKWLKNKQIDLYHLPSGRAGAQLLQELAERYPIRGAYVAKGAAGDSRRLSRLRLQLLRKTALTHANYLERLYQHMPLSNLLKNLRHLPRAFYVNQMKDAFKEIPAIICGAGPSLNASIETLKQLENRALIIAGGSAIAALSARGITPHFLAAIDPNPDEFQRLKNGLGFEIPLLFSTRLHPDSINALNGPLGYIRSGMAGIPELWFEEQLELFEPILGHELPSESLSVTTLSTAIAHHFGCNPILFDGLDLAYTGKRRYAEGVGAHESSLENLQPVDRTLTKRDKQGQKVTSAVRWVMECKSLSQFARKKRERRWINCTVGGLPLTGVEEMPLADIARTLTEERDLRAIVHAAIQTHPMPSATEGVLKEKREELEESLNRLIGHLEILATGVNKGLSVLAELELKEELAYDILFYDIEKTLSAALHCDHFHEDKAPFWRAFQELALNCKKAFCQQ